MQAVRDKLGYSPERGTGMLQSAYSAATCRGTCLLRHIWEHCGCLLLSGNMPFFNSSLLCGQIHSNLLTDLLKVGNESCVDIQSMLGKKCRPILTKLFRDLRCVRRVLRMQEAESESVSEESNGENYYHCQCPMPCRSQEYYLSQGSSRWPSPGPELDSAYISIVENKVIPFLQRFNSSITQNAIDYLSDTTNRVEIMENFARITVYIKSLKVERVEQIADYTFIDLLSDIGRKTNILLF